MNTKNAKERVHDWITRGTFDPEKGCRHPVDLIAAALELNERTVRRCVEQLEADGRMRVIRPRKRGECNTYFVAVWNPNLRSPVLDRIRQVKPAVLKRRQAKCPPNGTAKPSRALTLASPHVETSRRNPAALVRRASNCAERNVMSAEPAPTPHLRVVDHPEIAGLKAEIARLQRALDAALVDLDNAETDLVVKRRRIKQLENELAEKYRSDSLYGTAEIIYEFWRTKCSPNARTFSEDRLKAVLARLKDRSPSDHEQPAYTPRYICEAVLGAAVEPYVDSKGKRHNDLELICRSGGKLENFHERWERHKAKHAANSNGGSHGR